MLYISVKVFVYIYIYIYMCIVMLIIIIDIVARYGWTAAAMYYCNTALFVVVKVRSATLRAHAESIPDHISRGASFQLRLKGRLDSLF